MPEYQRALTVDASPDELFEYLSKVENLPDYFAGLKEAHSATGDEVHVTARVPAEATAGGHPEQVESNASFSVDADRRAIRWGTPALNDHDYGGSLEVTPDGERARLAVTLHTEHDDPDTINAGIDQTLRNVERIVTRKPRLQN
ncbi:SRPBCC family protein [Kineosporia sp. J2-2]|uniref:SRPBCC family protein n=1 Tax=Kineosporia corallincola TaxID=2835133 RepID=A0ABS5TID4_9ACTN|nr:SRPBCC family protein [Kineosporia corallincola]MBT0770854.1 SRPBCC family protein [Kineosporia corallincola]